MKKLIAVLMIVGQVAVAQTNRPTFIKGDIDISYNTRIQVDSAGKPNPKATDVYKLNINVSDSALFRGSIVHTPIIMGVIGVSQPSSLSYEMDCDVVNPANPAQTRNVGRIYGVVPIDQAGVYRFVDGSLKVSVNAIGTAKGFESKFGGLAAGKPIVKKGFFENLKKEVLTVSKQVQGKTVSLAVAKYDKMVFQNHVLAAGPVQIYPESTVNGSMLYDYARYAWYFQNITISYVTDGKQLVDRLGGNIRWVESPARKNTGEGEYQFDIRVNEPPPSESSVFSGASDEAAFFAVDNSIPTLSGTMKYKDTIVSDKVTSSKVRVELAGNQLTRQQAMNLCKLLVFSAIVPINAE